MGHVYTGWHEKEGRRVAIKIIRGRLRRNPFFMRQFQKEANAIVALDHPGIVRCVDCRMEQGRPFFVMGLIEGLPLNEYLGGLFATWVTTPTTHYRSDSPECCSGA